ncbi:CLUMA_CG020913, isoform B [Clunio marinus]|uniref:Diacylglycerol kinase n=1 Tax=Clunio marinus TaxID=568069 RepID=A0A1J1JAU8_9DIPT|nr:CLUMA_CG020913, isoform B [Clunio marinus]
MISTEKRTSGDGTENPSKLLNEGTFNSLPKTTSTNEHDIDKLGKQYLSKQFQSTSSILYDPSDAESDSFNFPKPVQPKGKRFYLIPKLKSLRKPEVPLKDRKLNLVLMEPYRACVKPIIPHHGDKKSIKISNKNQLEISELVNHMNMNKIEAFRKLSQDETDESKIGLLKKERDLFENKLNFQMQVNTELKGLLVHCLGEDLQAKVNNLTEDKMKIAKSLSTNTEQIEYLSSQSEVWRSKFLASSLMVEELAKMKAELTQRNSLLLASNNKLINTIERVRLGLMETFQNLKFVLDVEEINPKSVNILDLTSECLSISQRIVMNSGKIGLPSSLNYEHLEALTPAEKNARQVLTQSPNFCSTADEAFEAVCNQAHQEYRQYLNKMAYGGHSFGKKTFHKPTYCHHCSDLLWGLIGQGYICEVCEYYAHIECQDFAIADCKENATYVPGKELVSVKHVHHWREGNLPQSSKCAYCKKTCWSTECLTGYRCEWCGFTSHGGCRHFVSQECTFGMLQPIYLPPHAVSIPRTEVPMEAIIGVQVKAKGAPMTREYSCPELRTLELCESDLSSLENYEDTLYFNGTESQQSSDKSLYDNIINKSNMKQTVTDIVSSKFLLPPKEAFKNSLINRSKSFQEQGESRKKIILRPRIMLKRKNIESDRFESNSNCSSLTHFGSSQIEMNVNFHKTQESADNICSSETRVAQEDLKLSKRSNGPFYMKFLRRVQKFSLQWRKCKRNIRARSISDDLSSGDAARFRDDEYGKSETGGMGACSSVRNESAHKGEKDKEKKEKDKEDRDEETIKVFDGNCSLRRRIFRAITVPRTCSLEQLLTTALRAFHITKDPTQFYLTDLYATNGDEIQIQEPMPVLNLQKIEGKRPAIFLRFRDKEIDKGFVRVYPGKLQVEESYVTVQVDNDTTVKELIREALNNFGLHDHQIEDYRCSEILLDRGVTERVLSWNERPWDIMKQLAKDSIRQMELMRFYLQLKQDPHGPNLALFVGNLPPGLSQRNYEQILTEFLGVENKFSSIGPIYYEYGSLVITYENASKAVRALYALRESKYEEKHLLVLLLYVFRHIQDYKILVCGGDGTIGWVLQCLDNVGQDSECSSPPCAIVPLGTGNDLARVLRWGAGYTGGEDPLNLLRDVIDAEEIRLDRWTVVFHPEDKPEDVAPKAPSNSTGKKKKIQQADVNSQSNQHQQYHATTISTPQCQVVGGQSEDNSQIFVMNNYFGIGIDADLCLDFHNAREENPNKFNSRLHNKGVYVKMGLRKMVGRKMCKDLHKEIRLEVDGKLVELPPVEGIIILNILSWGSGANPWGPEKEDAFSKPNHWDGMLEVVGVTGVVHLGQIQSGLRSAMRIAQGGHIKIHLHSDIPVQVDGEPWVQSPGDVVVLKSALKATMLKKLKGKMKRRNTEPTMSAGSNVAGHQMTLVTPAEPDEFDQNNTDF